MAAALSASWAQIFEQIAGSATEQGGRKPAEILSLRPHIETDAGAPETERDAPSDDDAGDVTDWTAVLDIINGMGGSTGELKRRLKLQQAAHQAEITDLRGDIASIRDQVRASEEQAQEMKEQADARVRELQAQAEARVENIRADAEARIRTLQAQAEGRVRAAEERARTAELRADTAEKWLKRISEAAKRQLLNGHVAFGQGVG